MTPTGATQKQNQTTQNNKQGRPGEPGSATTLKAETPQPSSQAPKESGFDFRKHVAPVRSESSYGVPEAIRTDGHNHHGYTRFHRIIATRHRFKHLRLVGCNALADHTASPGYFFGGPSIQQPLLASTGQTTGGSHLFCCSKGAFDIFSSNTITALAPAALAI